MSSVRKCAVYRQISGEPYTEHYYGRKSDNSLRPISSQVWYHVKQRCSDCDGYGIYVLMDRRAKTCWHCSGRGYTVFSEPETQVKDLLAGKRLQEL